MLALAPLVALALLAPAFQAKTSSCEAGFYVHSDNKGCYPCGSNAVTCKSKGKALSCKSGYSVKDGLCKASTSEGVTVTVRPSGATVTSTLVRTSSGGVATVTQTATATTSAAVATSTVTSSELSTVTSTLTKVSTSTILSTTTDVTETSTSTQTSISHVSTPTGRAAYSLYGGCVSMRTIGTLALGSWRVTVPTPYTASTAIQSCYYQISVGEGYAFQKFNACVIGGAAGGYIAWENYADLSQLAAAVVDDSFCDQLCSDVTGVTTTSAYGQEYCGSKSGLYGSYYPLVATTY